MGPDDEVCYCFHVSQRKLVNHLRIHKPRVPSQMSECFSAGTGCGWCVPILKQMFAGSKAGAGPGSDADGMTAAEYARRRAAYIRAGHGVPAAGATPLPKEEGGESETGG